MFRFDSFTRGDLFSLTVLFGMAFIWQEHAVVTAQESKPATDSPLEAGQFHWRVGQPVLGVDQERFPSSLEHPWVAVKDPSIVRHDGRWHLFCTLRKLKQGDGRIRIGYLSFEDWSQAATADWAVLTLTMQYHGAPQIFYFEPHKKWYLVYQAADDTRGLKYGPCYSTTTNLNDPASWTLPEPMYVVKDGAKAGLDYWVICDESHAYVFFTTLDGRMWRAQTELAEFPNSGWSEPVVALKADIFEASHTYKLAGRDQYFTVVEAKTDKRRYFKAFVADSLDGTWRPLAASLDKPFVGISNVVNQSESWATSYSHGEFIRLGNDQKLQVDAERMQLLFQGANDDEYQRAYGEIPWRLGLLKIESP